MNKFYVYMYMDQDNVPFYIGMGCGNRYLVSRHLRDSHPHLNNKIRKIGQENVKIHFLHKNISEEESLQWECYWIKYLGRKNNGTGQLTNLTDGGDHPKLSDETKRKISGALKGRKLSDEHRKNMSRANKGRKLSDETKRKMSESKKGKSSGMLGKKMSDEAKRKNSGAHKGKSSGMLGKKHSEESKRKISEGLKNSYKNNGRDDL